MSNPTQTLALDDATLQALAAHLDSAVQEVRDVVKLTDAQPRLGLPEAYAVQDHLRARCLARGARLSGFKAGLTSLAKMRQMNVATPVFGYLLDTYAVPAGGEVDMPRLIHPKVEPEIAFVMARELRGPHCTVAAVLAATDYVTPAVEVIDSRYRDFKFDLPSVVADNTSAARYVLGTGGADPRLLDLRTLGVVLERNGAPVAFGAGAAVVGHPAAAVAMLVNHLAARGEALPAGAVVLSGGITEAVAIAPGDQMRLRVQSVGELAFRCAGNA
jgi:2-oxo-3-hexenedioate decarboxylase